MNEMNLDTVAYLPINVKISTVFFRGHRKSTKPLNTKINVDMPSSRMKSDMS